jgi:tetratricopeptide (TPR) repeat protein
MNNLRQVKNWIMRSGILVSIAIGFIFKSWVAGVIYFIVSLIIVVLIGKYLERRDRKDLLAQIKKEKENSFRVPSSEEYFRLADDAISREDFSQAFRFFNLIKNDKKYASPEIYHVMAECLLQNKDYKLVDKVLSEGITKYPKDSNLFYMRAMNRGTLKDIKGKIKDLETALKKYTRYPENKNYNEDITEDDGYDTIDKLYLAELNIAKLVKQYH